MIIYVSMFFIYDYMYADGPVVRIPNQLWSGRCKYSIVVIKSRLLELGFVAHVSFCDGPFIDEDSHALLDLFE